MAEKKEKDETAETPRRGLFGVYDDVKDLVTNEIGRFKLEKGNNRLRIITAPIPIGKHWDVPESGEAKVVPCLKFFGDRLAEMGDPKKKAEIVANLPDCPWCNLEAEYGDKVLGKDKGYYNRQYSHSMGVLAGGKSLIFEASQKSIMDGLSRFENDEDWASLMPNGLQDMEIIIKKIDKGGKVSYEVGAAPATGPLTDEELEEARKNLPDIIGLCRPPIPGTEEGDAAIEELLRKNGEPRKGDRPKKNK